MMPNYFEFIRRDYLTCWSRKFRDLSSKARAAQNSLLRALTKSIWNSRRLVIEIRDQPFTVPGFSVTLAALASSLTSIDQWVESATEQRSKINRPLRPAAEANWWLESTPNQRSKISRSIRFITPRVLGRMLRANACLWIERMRWGKGRKLFVCARISARKKH